jgi:alpha-glucosidase
LPFKIDKIEVDNEAIDISKINGVVTFEVTKEFRELYITGK